jgi:hypothetical protein
VYLSGFVKQLNAGSRVNRNVADTTTDKTGGHGNGAGRQRGGGRGGGRGGRGGGRGGRGGGGRGGGGRGGGSGKIHTGGYSHNDYQKLTAAQKAEIYELREKEKSSNESRELSAISSDNEPPPKKQKPAAGLQFGQGSHTTQAQKLVASLERSLAEAKASL